MDVIHLALLLQRFVQRVAATRILILGVHGASSTAGTAGRRYQDSFLVRDLLYRRTSVFAATGHFTQTVRQ